MEDPEAQLASFLDVVDSDIVSDMSEDSDIDEMHHKSLHTQEITFKTELGDEVFGYQEDKLELGVDSKQAALVNISPEVGIKAKSKQVDDTHLETMKMEPPLDDQFLHTGNKEAGETESKGSLKAELLENVSTIGSRVWKEYIDPATQNSFYMDTLTKKTQWERPDVTDVVISSEITHERKSVSTMPQTSDSSNLRSSSDPSITLSTNGSAHGMTIRRQYLTLKNLAEQEEHYVKHLENLINVYLRPLQVLAQQHSKEADLLKMPAVGALLSNVFQVKLVSQELVLDLQALLRNARCGDGKSLHTGEVLLRYTELFRVYGRFAEHYGLSKADLRESVREDVDLKAFLKKADLQLPESSRGHSLMSLLGFILGRVSAYLENLEHQMLQMVQEDEDYPRLQVVVSFMRDASAYVENASEARRNMETLREVEKEFGGTIKLMRQGRHFVRRGFLGKFNRRGNEEDLVFHLFNDLLLYSDQSGKTYSVRRKIPLHSCEVKIDERLTARGNTFTITSASKSFVVSASTPHEMNEWMSDIGRCIKQSRARNLVMSTADDEEVDKPSVSITNTAPLWEPDSERFTCNMCKEAFNFIRRRHHCRQCGNLVCSKCSGQKRILDNIGPKPVRVCDTCVNSISESSSTSDLTGTAPDRNGALVTDSAGTMGRAQAKALLVDNERPLSPEANMFQSRSWLDPVASRVASPPSEQRKLSVRYRVVREILDTEITYIQNLEMLLRVFIRPLMRKLLSAPGSRPKGKSKGDTTLYRKSLQKPSRRNSVVAVFCDSIEFIMTLNCKLLQEISGRMEKWDDSTCIGDIFHALAGLFKVYGDYAVHADEVAQILESAEYVKFLTRCKGNYPESSETLASLLIMPIQRVPRYILLLRELIKNTPSNHSDLDMLQKSLDKMSISASHINDVISHREDREKVMRLEDRFFGDVSLASATRALVREGQLYKYTRRGKLHRIVVHLFNDMLIYSQMTPVGLKLKRKMLLKEVVVQKDPERSGTLKICSPSKSFQVQGKEEEIVKWMESIQLCIDEQRDIVEKDESSEHIAPVWVMNSSTSKCEICDVPFSLFNRRHHCRKCGHLCCNSCSPRPMILKNISATKPQRVCVNCEAPSAECHFDPLTQAALSVAAPILALEKRRNTPVHQ